MQTYDSEPFTAVYVMMSRFALIAAFITLWSTCLRAKVSTVSPSASDSVDFRPIERSGRIAALKQRVESGDSRALDQFWREAERTGTPLVERAQDNSH